MSSRTYLAGAALATVGAFAAGAVSAQGLGTRPTPSAVESSIGTQPTTDTIDDIQLRTQRELEQAEDAARFGTASVPAGFAGSLALTGVATDGNTDTVDLGIAGSFTLGQGRLNHSFGVAVEYGEVDDERDRNRILGIYDLSYDLSDRFYAFGLLRGEYDEFASRNEQDFFGGVGPGYRVLNSPDLAWRVQAGPGVRYTKNIEDGDTNTDLAAIASSRVYWQVTQDAFLTLDTDVLYSDVDTLVSNEVAFNTRIAGPLSGRVGLRTDYSTDPAEGQKSTDNRLSLGVVYSF